MADIFILTVHTTADGRTIHAAHELAVRRERILAGEDSPGELMDWRLP